MFDLLISGGTIITVDKDRRILRDGTIAVQDGAIVEVFDGVNDDLEAHQRLDATGHIVIPGLVDTHGHAGHCLTRGLALGASGDGWEETVHAVYFSASDPWFWKAESRIAAAERLRFGITTSMSMTGSAPRIDSPVYALAAATGYRETGLRHIVAVGPPQGPWPRRYIDRSKDPHGVEITADLDHALITTEELVQEFRSIGDPRLDFFIGPSAVSPSDDPTDDFAKAQVNGVVDLADRYGARIHAHAYAGQIAAAKAINQGILGERTLLAHCAGISLEEVAILAETGTHATSGPLTYAFATARFPVVEALDAGVNVVWSTDGTAPDRSFDLLDQARIGVQLQRAYFHDTELLPIGKTLEMITIDAARAIGKDHLLGSIEPGKRADIVLLDARQAHLGPEILPLARLIGHASGLDVRTVLVDGQILMRDGKSNLDLERILDDGKDALFATWERTGLGDIEHLHPDTWGQVRYRA